MEELPTANDKMNALTLFAETELLNRMLREASKL